MVAAPKRRAETFLTSPSVFLSLLLRFFLLVCLTIAAGSGRGGYLSKFRIHFSRFRDRKSDSTLSQYYLYYQTLDIYLKSRSFCFDYNLDNNYT